MHDASLWLACSVHSEVEAGDHLVVLLTVHGLKVDRAASPLVRSGPSADESEPALSGAGASRACGGATVAIGISDARRTARST
jgi:flavin reductase (DIM6/NTAB) family NADH-FMN oxidoreductase RutF